MAENAGAAIASAAGASRWEWISVTCLDYRRGEHVQHDLIGNEVTAGLTGRDLAAMQAASPGLGPQQVTGGNVPGAGPHCQPLSL